MNYYKLRSVVMQSIKQHLEDRQSYLDREMAPPPFSSFQNKLMLDYGVTERMIRGMVEQLVPGGTVKDGDIVVKKK